MRANVLALLVLLYGCDCGFKPVVECREGGCAGGAGGGAGGGSGGAGGSCAECVSSDVSWGWNGGFVAYTDRSSLSLCRTYHHERQTFTQPQKTTSCEQQLATCPVRLNELLKDPTVAAALSAKMLYGEDTRPVDGSLFEIGARGGLIQIGSCTPDCRPAPVKELQELLEAMDTQQLALEPCKSSL